MKKGEKQKSILEDSNILTLQIVDPRFYETPTRNLAIREQISVGPAESSKTYIFKYNQFG